MTTTPNLLIPLLAAEQAQKHVTMNEALLALDALVHLTVISDVVIAPPGSPAEGDRYIVPVGATGVWTGLTNQIAGFISGAWTFFVPEAGWSCWNLARSEQLIWSGSRWRLAGGGTPQQMLYKDFGASALVWKAQPNSTGVSAIGAAAPTSVGTATAASVAVTDLVTQTPRLEYLVTVAAVNAVAGFRGTAPIATVGGAAAGVGGFAFVGRWGPAIGVATATERAFFGLANVTIAPTDVDPSTQTNCIFMGWDSANSNIQLMHNDGSGTCTSINLGAAFPRPTVDRANLYELWLESPKGPTQSVDWIVTDLISGAVASGTITTNLPSTSTLLAPRGWMSVGGTSSVIGLGLASIVFDPLL